MSRQLVEQTCYINTTLRFLLVMSRQLVEQTCYINTSLRRLLVMSRQLVEQTCYINTTLRLVNMYFIACCRAELLSFAVTHCTCDMIEPIIRAKCLLETQVSVLYQYYTSMVCQLASIMYLSIKQLLH